MNAIKNSLKTVRASFEGVPFLKFMVTAGAYIFAAGGLLWLIAGFIPTVTYGFVPLVFLKTLIATFGRLLIVAGLIFAVLKEEELILMIVSAAISVGALVVAIIEVAAPRYFASFESWFFFLLFGGLAALVFIFGDKMKDFRAKAKQNAQAKAAERAAQQAAAQAAAAQAAPQVQLIECPNCKGPVPINVQFCPNCGAPNPAMQYQQAPPAPPTAPPPVPEAPEAPLEAAPAAAPEVPPVAAPEAPPIEAPPVAAPPVAEPEAPEAPATKKCVACGADITATAAFCGQCGAKQ